MQIFLVCCPIIRYNGEADGFVLSALFVILYSVEKLEEL